MLSASDVSIRPYSTGDMWVLERTLGTSSEMEHLNGPESPEQIQRRHQKYLAMSADQHVGCMYTVTVGPSAAGTVGYWETDWEGEKVWETGWFTLPEFQRRGVASKAMEKLIDVVSRLTTHRYLVAFPSSDNGPSNAVARKVGFELVKEIDSEYPPNSGKFLHNNVWRLDLKTAGLESLPVQGP